MTPYKVGAISTHPILEMRTLRPKKISHTPKKIRLGLGLDWVYQGPFGWCTCHSHTHTHTHTHTHSTNAHVVTHSQSHSLEEGTGLSVPCWEHTPTPKPSSRSPPDLLGLLWGSQISHMQGAWSRVTALVRASSWTQEVGVNPWSWPGSRLQVLSPDPRSGCKWEVSVQCSSLSKINKNINDVYCSTVPRKKPQPTNKP